MNASPVEKRLRQFALGLTLMVFVATTVELFLLDHDEEALQLLPFALCAIGFAAALAALLRPERVVLLALRVIMAMIGAGGLLGVVIHLQRNFAFEQEIRPAEAFGALILPMLKGAAPATAPAVMVFAALLAIGATYAHPALASNRKNK